MSQVTENKFNTTIKRECEVCTDAKPKATFKHCVACLNKVCADCGDRVTTCPFCRASPYITGSLVQNVPVVPVLSATDAIVANAKKLLYNIFSCSTAYNSTCHCRSNCKHSRCKCYTHNPRAKFDFVKDVNDAVINFGLYIEQYFKTVELKKALFKHLSEEIRTAHRIAIVVSEELPKDCEKDLDCNDETEHEWGVKILRKCRDLKRNTSDALDRASVWPLSS